MSDHEDIIDLNNTYANESCINTYSSESNRSNNVKFLKLDSISLDDERPTFKPKIVEEQKTNIIMDINYDDNNDKNKVNVSNNRKSNISDKPSNITNNDKKKVQIIEIIDNNGWNDKNEKLLSYWKEESHIIIWLNTQALNELKFINKALSIPAILISAISSATLFSNFNTDNKSERVNIIILIIGILLIISTFIQSLKEFLNLDKNIRQHINIIKTNQMLILDIQEQLNQEIHDRVNGKDFLSKIKLKKADMVRNNVEIPPKIYKKMERAIENGDIINYDETFILYSYLQNKLTNHNILNPHGIPQQINVLNSNMNNDVNKTVDTRIDIPPIPYSTSTNSQFDREKNIIEPYKNLEEIKKKVNKLKQEENEDKISIGSQDSGGSVNSTYSQGSINSRTDLQFNKKHKKGKQEFETSANDYVMQIKNQIARL